MDLTTILGLLIGMGLMYWGMSGAGDIRAFIDVPSITIVFGGVLATVLISFPGRRLLGTANVLRKAFFQKSRDPHTLIQQLVALAETARRDGILALDNRVKELDDPFIVNGIQLTVDGNDPEIVQAILTEEVEAMESRHAEGKAVLDNMGRFGPAFGMIGTLIGMVIMLKNMSDPSSIGPAMAVAMLTTLYGSYIAFLFVGPLGEKLGYRSREESLLKQLAIKGILAIQAGDNPRMVERKLLAYLPVARRKAGLAGGAAAPESGGKRDVSAAA